MANPSANGRPLLQIPRTHTSFSLREAAAITRQFVEKHGGTGFTLAKDDMEAEDIWTDRKNALYTGLALVNGSKGWVTDVW